MDTSNVAPVLDDLAQKINEEHECVEGAFKTAMGHALKAGELLIEAKGAAPHSGWLPWLEANCSFSKRTAQAYMRLAREMPKLDPEKAQRVAHLSFRDTMKALANDMAAVSAAPEEAATIALDRIESGEGERVRQEVARACREVDVARKVPPAAESAPLNTGDALHGLSIGVEH